MTWIKHLESATAPSSSATAPSSSATTLPARLLSIIDLQYGTAWPITSRPPRDIAAYAQRFSHNLKVDEGAEYDQIIDIVSFISLSWCVQILINL